MKIEDLIQKLQEISMLNPNATVYIDDQEYYYDFTGFSVDDNTDVQLYIVSGDEQA